MDRLDPCHACDERFCGHAFVECAGANRRRVGVVSDIERDLDVEVCTKVDWEWILQEDQEDGSRATQAEAEEQVSETDTSEL